MSNIPLSLTTWVLYLKDNVGKGYEITLLTYLLKNTFQYSYTLQDFMWKG